MLAALAAQDPLQDPNESELKISVSHRVNHRIQGRVEVACSEMFFRIQKKTFIQKNLTDPEKQGHYFFWTVASLPADSGSEVPTARRQY